MKASLTITERIVCIVLLFIGILLTHQALDVIIYYRFGVVIDSYRIAYTTLVSNLINGNLLIISSLIFFYKRSLGALFYQCVGIMCILYALNLDLLDIIFRQYYESLTMLISAFVLLPFGLFLFFYFKRRNSLYKNKLIMPLCIILGVLTYLYINLLFGDWNSY